MANVKLSQIAPSPANVDTNTQLVGVEGGNTDYLFTAQQLIAGQNLATLNTPDQIVSGGANISSKSLVAGSVTIDCGACPLQFIANNGAFAINAPASDGSVAVLITNGIAAGVVTFSGFSVGSSTGDALTTTSGQKFTVFIWRINGVSGYRIAAHQ